MFLSDQGTDYLEIHWFPYVSKILSSKIGQIYELLKMHAMKMGAILGLKICEIYGNQCIFR